MRRLILALLAVVGVATATNSASAQYFNPYYYPPSGLWNMPTVYNPWARYHNNYYIPPAAYYNYAVQYNYSSIYNPSLYPAFGYGYNNYGYGYQNLGFNQFIGLDANALALNNGFGLNNGTFVQKEVGGFVPVNRTTAVNPVSGTVLKPYRGVAYTREGTFYQVPGTGSITAWGTYLPGSGVYVNPFSGTQYNPATGLIVR